MKFKRGDRVRYVGPPNCTYTRRLGEKVNSVFTVMETFHTESLRMVLSDLDENPEIAQVLRKLDGGSQPPFRRTFDAFYFEFEKVKKKRKNAKRRTLQRRSST